MNKNEALKASIDGAKIRPVPKYPHDMDYVYFDGSIFCIKYKSGREVKCWLLGDCEWEIVPEYVDFATAWKAYEAGKIIKGESGKEYQRNEHEHHWRFSTDDIRGKWIILEDE